MTNRSLLFVACLGCISLVQAQSTAPTCDDLVWSAQVLAENPDIRESCQGVYQRGDDLFAKVTIQVTRVSGNRLGFRALHLDGSLGKPRSISVPSTWRARLDGQEYRARDLMPGQRLYVYVPEDRFALAMENDKLTWDEELELFEIENATVVKPE